MLFGNIDDFFFFVAAAYRTFPHYADTPLVFMHGYTNALEGDVCINYTGAEFYSKDDYQKTKESNLITNAMHCNLMFDDGRPMEPRLPKGITGWLAEALKV